LCGKRAGPGGKNRGQSRTAKNVKPSECSRKGHRWGTNRKGLAYERGGATGGEKKPEKSMADLRDAGKMAKKRKGEGGRGPGTLWPGEKRPELKVWLKGNAGRKKHRESEGPKRKVAQKG